MNLYFLSHFARSRQARAQQPSLLRGPATSLFVAVIHLIAGCAVLRFAAIAASASFSNFNQ